MFKPYGSLVSNLLIHLFSLFKRKLFEFDITFSRTIALKSSTECPLELKCKPLAVSFLFTIEYQCLTLGDPRGPTLLLLTVVLLRVLMVPKNLSVCLPVVNFEPNYLRTGETEWEQHSPPPA